MRLPFSESVQEFLRRHPDEFYLGGIEILTLLIVLAIMTPVFSIFNTFLGRIFAILVLLLPASQSAVEVMNYLTTALLPPRILPKLDFSEGIPGDCVTMVVVPTLLLSEKQVRQLVDDLEVRYLGNSSANLHYALLSDMPDSAEAPNEDDPLVDLAAQLIRDLNEKYEGNGCGTFSLFHRHRIYNPREGVWMGWERKRGKLLDFNRLINGRVRQLSGKDRRSVAAAAGALCDHARQRHRTAARHRASTGRRDGASAEPGDHRSAREHRCRRLRDLAAARRHQRAERVAVAAGQHLFRADGFDIYTRATSDVYQDL